MTTSDTPWEPPFAGTEVEHVLGALDRLRTTFRWKADDLVAIALKTQIGTSSLKLGGLLKHLATQEDYAFTTKMSGEPLGEPWAGFGWDGSRLLTTGRPESTCLATSAIEGRSEATNA
jgi:hypothetical protein